MTKVRILVDNNKSRVVGSRKAALILHEELKLKHPRYFWSVAYRRRQWDGYVRYVTETGTFSTGHLNQVLDVLKSRKIKYKLEDQRETFKDLHIVRRLGNKDAREYQIDALVTMLENEYEGIKYVRGILHEATNAGKNLIAAGLIKSFSNKRKWLFLIDNSVIYDQAKKELKELLPDEDVGWVRGKDIRWGRITICMVQTLGNVLKRDPKVKQRLADIDGILVDECDSTLPKKPCQKIVAYAFNAPIRIGLSGTPLSSKDKTRNQMIIGFFGPVVHHTSNKQLVDQGFSAKPYIRIKQGNVDHDYPGDYEQEYRLGIIKNKDRNTKIWKIVARQIQRGRSPILILIKNHAHIDYLMQTCPANIKDNYAIASVHHKTSGREGIFEKFKKQKIPILISSMIIKRGKNLPSLKTLVNAAGGDSETNALQILGRGLRKEKGVKEKLWLYDFWDKGKYLRRHSFHRVKFYKSQGFKVKELYTK